MTHGLSSFRVSQALSKRQPQRLSDVWDVLQSIGFEPYVGLGRDDFDEIVKHGGKLLRGDYAQFNPVALLKSETVTDHVKALVRELCW